MNSQGQPAENECSNERHTSYDCASFIVWMAMFANVLSVSGVFFNGFWRMVDSHAKTSIDTNDFQSSSGPNRIPQSFASMWKFSFSISLSEVRKCAENHCALYMHSTYLFRIYLFMDPLNQSQSQLSALLSNSYREVRSERERERKKWRAYRVLLLLFTFHFDDGKTISFLIQYYFIDFPVGTQE